MFYRWGDSHFCETAVVVVKVSTKWTVDQMNSFILYVDQMTVDQMTVDQMSVDQMTVDQMNERRSEYKTNFAWFVEI